MKNYKKGSAIAIGVAIGVALGVALNNIAVWIAVGTALGIAMDQSYSKRKPPEESSGSQE